MPAEPEYPGKGPTYDMMNMEDNVTIGPSWGRRRGRTHGRSGDDCGRDGVRGGSGRWPQDHNSCIIVLNDSSPASPSMAYGVDAPCANAADAVSFTIPPAAAVPVASTHDKEGNDPLCHKT